MKRQRPAHPDQGTFLQVVEVVPPPQRKGKRGKDWSNQANHEAENTHRVVESEVRFEDGPLFRAKRMVLGLSVGDLVPGRERVRLLIDEDGRRPGQWWRYWPLLQKRFEQHVRDHVRSGQSPWSLRLNPWSMSEILKAVEE